MAVGTEHVFSQIDDAGSIEKRQPERITVENAQIAIEKASAEPVWIGMNFVPMDRLEPVDRVTHLRA